MARIKIIPIGKEETCWFNIYQDESDLSVKDEDMTVKDKLWEFIGNRAYTLWKTNELENYVLQIHPG